MRAILLATVLGVLALVLTGRLTPFNHDAPPQRVASAPTEATPAPPAASPPAQQQAAQQQAAAPPAPAPAPSAPPVSAPLQDRAVADAKANQTPGPAPAATGQSDALARGAIAPEQTIAPGRTAYTTEKVCARSFWGALNCTETFVWQ